MVAIEESASVTLAKGELGWFGLVWPVVGWLGLGWIGLGWAGLGLGWLNVSKHLIYTL